MLFDLQLNKFPLEIQERILYFTGSKQRLYIDQELNPWELFLDGGLYILLRTIIREGGDLKALFYLKSKISCEIAIVLACQEKNIQATKNVCLVWENAKYLELGYETSLRSDFYWGIKNLCPQLTKYRPHWKDIMIHKQFHRIPTIYKGQCKSMCEHSIFNFETRPEWLLETPKVYYGYFTSWAPAIATLHQGNANALLDYFTQQAEKSICSHLKKSELPVFLHNIIFTFGKKNSAIVDGVMSAYNTVLNKRPFDKREVANIVFSVIEIVVHFIKQNSQGLLHELKRVEKLKPYIEQSINVIDAIENKDEHALRVLLPTAHKNMEELDELDMQFTELYFHIMNSYDFLTDVETPTHDGTRNFIDPNALFTRVLRDNHVRNEDRELYESSLYYLRIQEGGSNDTVVSGLGGALHLIDEPLERPETFWSVLERGFQRELHLQAIYECYKSDQGFKIKDKSSFTMNPSGLSQDCIIWILYRILKEDIPIQIEKQSPTFSLRIEGKEKYVSYSDSCYRIDFSTHTDISKRIEYESIMVAWEKLQGIKTPNIAF